MSRKSKKTLSSCLFKSCSHQEKSMVFPFFFLTIAYASCFFGHVLATWKFQKGGGRRGGDQLLSLRITKILLTSFFIVRGPTRIYIGAELHCNLNLNCC